MEKEPKSTRRRLYVPIYFREQKFNTIFKPQI